jgi:hypothetical protein
VTGRAISGLVGITVLAAGCTPAEWSRTDTAIEVAYGATLAADYLQTRQIVADGLEDNFIMGERGQNLPPAVYFRRRWSPTSPSRAACRGLGEPSGRASRSAGRSTRSPTTGGPGTRSNSEWGRSRPRVLKLDNMAEQSYKK